jgi:hypothetical protein
MHLAGPMLARMKGWVSSMAYCMCGADDCPRCHSENFRRGQYIGDMDDDELERFEDVMDEAECNSAEAYREDHGKW